MVEASNKNRKRQRDITSYTIYIYILWFGAVATVGFAAVFTFKLKLNLSLLDKKNFSHSLAFPNWCFLHFVWFCSFVFAWTPSLCAYGCYFVEEQTYHPSGKRFLNVSLWDFVLKQQLSTHELLTLLQWCTETWRKSGRSTLTNITDWWCNKVLLL